MADSGQTSKGVEALIEKLRGQGVDAGRAEAGKIESEAKDRAAQIIANAEAKAETLIKDARQKADQYRKAGEEALDTAMRDSVLTMKTTLMAQFESDVKRMVSERFADPEMLKTMILELVGRARETAGETDSVEVILPREVVDSQSIRDNPTEVKASPLSEFVLGLTQDMLREGVTLHAADEMQAGIHARVIERNMELDLSDEAIASLLMKHLQPRFRAVMEGVIR